VSDIYAQIRANAHDTIRRKGQPVIVYRIGADTYDPVNPADAEFEVQSSFTGVGVVLPSNKATIEAFDARLLSDPLKAQNFRYVLFSGYQNTFEPALNDVLKVTEGYYRIRGITKIDPSGTGPIILNLYCFIDETIDLP
jgi:hypothetical protein